MMDGEDPSASLAVLLGGDAEPGDEGEDLNLKEETKRASADEMMMAISAGDRTAFRNALETFVKACYGHYDED